MPAELVYQIIKNKGLIQPASHCLTCPPWQCIPSPTHLICIALEGAEGIGGAMALEVVPAAAGRLHSDQYSKIL